jgi:DNA-binding IclR family transcriptional regulator
VESQTFLILEALGHPDRAAVVTALLEKTGREKDLVDELGLAQTTASRHFAMLRQVGLVTRASAHGRYDLTAHVETRAALEAVNTLARAIVAARSSEDEALGQRIRRSRFSPADQHGAQTSSL